MFRDSHSENHSAVCRAQATKTPTTHPRWPGAASTQGRVGIGVVFNPQNVSWVLRYHFCNSVQTLYTDTYHLTGRDVQVPCHGYAGTCERIDGIDHEWPSSS